MPERTETGRTSDDYLRTLEEVKKQYEQYVEVSELCKLPIQRAKEEAQCHPPSLEHPLTTNSIELLEPGRICLLGVSY